MYKTILASVLIYSIVLLSVGQIAAQCNARPREENQTEAQSCPTCFVAGANPLDRLATLGKRTNNLQLLPVTRPQSKGFPLELVSSSAGDLAFAQKDLVFKDNPFLLFERTYLSSRNEDFGLGRGWSFAFNDSIAVNDNNAVLTTSTGDNYTYRTAEPKHYVLQTYDSTDVKEFNVENGNTISARMAI